MHGAGLGWAGLGWRGAGLGERWAQVQRMGPHEVCMRQKSALRKPLPEMLGFGSPCHCRAPAAGALYLL